MRLATFEDLEKRQYFRRAFPTWMLLCAAFPNILRGYVLNDRNCIDTTGGSDERSYVFRMLENSSEDQRLQVEEAFVPHFYTVKNTLFLPKLIYIMFTCNDSEDLTSIIEDNRAFIWTSEFLLAYMHPEVIQIVALCVYI